MNMYEYHYLRPLVIPKYLWARLPHKVTHYNIKEVAHSGLMWQFFICFVFLKKVAILLSPAAFPSVRSSLEHRR